MFLTILSILAEIGGMTSAVTTNSPAFRRRSSSETGSAYLGAWYWLSPCHQSGWRTGRKTASQVRALSVTSRDSSPEKTLPVPTFRTWRTTSPQVSPPTLSQSSGGSTSSSISWRFMRKARS